MTGDLQAATGQMPYEPQRCRCGHLDTFHKPHDTGGRGACSASTCPCKQLTEERS